MPLHLIVNPLAGTAELLLEVRALLEDRDGWAIHQTEHAGHATELAARLGEDGSADGIIAAGGDGTIHEVVNGLMQLDERPPLGIVPVGTGNDLARPLQIPEDPLEAVLLIEGGETRALDVVRARIADEVAHAINVANGGNARLTAEAVDDEDKQRWGPLAYVLGAARVLGDLEAYDVTLSWPDGSTSTLSLFGLVVANGTHLGGGAAVAPHADPRDGLLDVIAIKEQPRPTLARAGARLFDASLDVTADDNLLFRRVPSLDVTAEPNLWFNLDGEPFGEGPAQFEALPGALDVFVPDDA